MQPEGTETGWIPLTGVAIGNKFGILSAPFINDQVEVHFHEGEHMVARILTRHFSTADAPPQIDPGEHNFVHQSGSMIYFKKDGTLEIGGASTVQTGPIGGGQSGNTSTDPATGETGQPTQQQTPPQPNAQQTLIFKPDGTMIIAVPNNDLNIVVGSPKPPPQGGPTPTPESTNYNLTSDQQINLTATNKDVTITASKTNINVVAKEAINITAQTQDVTIDASATNVNVNAMSGEIIVSSPTIKLGSSGSKNPVSMLGTIDTGGYADVINLSTRALTE